MLGPWRRGTGLGFVFSSSIGTHSFGQRVDAVLEMAGLNILVRLSSNLELAKTITNQLMNKIAISLLLCLAALQLHAADGEWMTDLPKAQAKAKAEKKMVLMDFTGSDWCPPCKALHKTVLTSKEFVEFAGKNLVLVELDFPNSKPQSEELKKANKELSEKFKIEGYPTVIVLDSTGKQLSKDVGYGGTTALDFIAKLEKLKKK